MMSPSMREFLASIVSMMKQSDSDSDFKQVQGRPLRQLRRDMITGDSHPIRYLLAEGIEHWTESSGKFSPVLSQYPFHIRERIEEALASQHRVGWKDATSGLLSCHRSSLACCAMYASGKRI
ncbi:hypothetical protein MHU86_16934 [Fragilaria crotonensis]|nr:hypothetical protein MHU86_16934 [Fragilaria crotonensis]